MYEEYFGLSGAPFKLNPDPRFFFGSRSHNKAMAYLHYGLKQAEGFIVITGPIGAGKTMLIGHLLDQLSRSEILAAQLLTSNIEPDELLSQILSAFRIEPEGEGRTGQLEAFEDYLFDQLNRGRRVLLIVDEAQNLPFKTLEELRMLSNIDYDGTPLFQVFLVGQPEFRKTLESPDYEQLKQRVIASYHLDGLSADESREYILHRLSIAGWQEDPAFTDGAFDLIYQETEGRPRRINTLTNRLLLFSALEKSHTVDADIVRQVTSELHDEQLGARNGADVETPSVTTPPPRIVKQKSEQKSEQAKKPKTMSVSGKPRNGDEDSGGVSPDDVERGVAAMKKMTFPPSDASVYDRLRNKRGTAGREELAPPPQAATLEDVASAIAAASSRARDLPEKQAASDAKEFSDLSAKKRKFIVKSITETRDELREAHQSVKKLRKTLSVMSKRRHADREKISESLNTAEKLLSEIRDAWR